MATVEETDAIHSHYTHISFYVVFSERRHSNWAYGKQKFIRQIVLVLNFKMLNVEFHVSITLLEPNILLSLTFCKQFHKYCNRHRFPN